MGFPKYCSASEMFVVNGVSPFGEILRKQIFAFRKRLPNSSFDSLIISAVYSTIKSQLHYIDMGKQYIKCVFQYAPL